jgi:hypothetical protein
MQFLSEKSRKVHYSALLGRRKKEREKTKIKALNAETQRKKEKVGGGRQDLKPGCHPQGWLYTIKR